jgi:phosphate transport system protein
LNERGLRIIDPGGGRSDMMETGRGGADWDSERVTLGRHFLRDMERLWGEILRMAAVVEVALNTAVRALCDARADLAAEVRGGEGAINNLDVQIERDCLKILALHQPVASDLRRVAAVLKIDRDLERMADLAEHIANRARKLARAAQPMPIPHELEVMALEVLEQVRECLDALVKADADRARAVIASDRGIDRRRNAVVRELKDAIRRDPERLNDWMRLINTARNLERVADHATNIAETVIYMKEGDIIRHVVDRRRVRSGEEH